MAKTYRFYTDPGHGWLAVKRKEIDALGIADRISGFSYTKGGTVYLEEDCDYSVFAEAKKARGEQVITVARSTDKRSPIRSYSSYSNS